MSCVGRVERAPSFSNLDDAPPSPLFTSSIDRVPGEPDYSTTTSASSSTPPDSDEKEEEENIIDVGECDYEKIAPFSSVYNTPPEKVRSSISELGTGIFCEIDEASGHYVYQFQNGRRYEF